MNIIDRGKTGYSPQDIFFGHRTWRLEMPFAHAGNQDLVIRTYLSIYFLTLIYWISAISAPVSSIAQHCNEIRKLVVSRRSILITC